MKKFLFIDDNVEWLESLSLIFASIPNVVFRECHTIKEALEAIAECRPDVIFLDHSLSENGDEGIKIADQLQEMGMPIKIYSTSANSAVAAEYQKRRIDSVGKINIQKIISIINS